MRGISSSEGPLRDQFLGSARGILQAIATGRVVPRRDAVAVARSVLESTAVRAAEAVLEADHRDLLPRLVELLNAVLRRSERSDLPHESNGA